MNPCPADRLRPLIARLDPRRADYAAIMARHDAAVAAGREQYPDPQSGYGVFTAATLWARGICCDAGCRHCPFIAGARSR